MKTFGNSVGLAKVSFTTKTYEMTLNGVKRELNHTIEGGWMLLWSGSGGRGRMKGWVGGLGCRFGGGTIISFAWGVGF